LKSLKYVALAATLLGLVYGLTAYPLLEPDEGRNAEVAREMAASNDYLLPQLDGLPYVDKPVLFFAVEAAAMELLGPGVLAARLPPLLFTLATLGVTAWFARRRSGADAAWTAVIATGAAPLTLGFARTVIFDSTLTFFVVAAVVAFYEATERRYGGKAVSDTGDLHTALPPYRLTDRSWSWAVLGWAAMALAVLTKGPIGLALPLMVIVPYALWRRAGRVLWTPAGPLLFAVLLMPWLMAMSRRVPDFLHYAVVTETLVRLATPALSRTGPLWYFIPIVLVGALPWTVVALAGLKQGLSRQPDGRRDHYPLFLLCWILVPLVFFSLSQSKRPQYVVPIVPAVALLVAHIWRSAARPAGAAAAGAALIAAGAAVGTAPWLLPHALPLSAPIRDALPQTAVWLGSLAAVAGVMTVAFRQRRDLTLLALALPVAAIPLASARLMREIGRERSSAELAGAIAKVLPPGSDVAAIGTLPLSLPFYLRRTVLLATATGAELTSNYLTRHADAWRLAAGSPLRPADWWLDAAKQCGRARVFVTLASDAATRTVLAAQVPLLIETPKYAAYGPCVSSDLARKPPLRRSFQLDAEVAENAEREDEGVAGGTPSVLFLSLRPPRPLR
jgi:4-amino-4-deoxy-L-arabinose transferase-like glycosyltransferase